jgi:tRNA(Ile)-lysidine synthase
MDNCFNTVLRFLKKHWDFSKPILLALSGGADSLSLLYLLLKCKEKLSIDLAIAHVDHRWRPESQYEAEQLGELSRQFNLSYHLKVLEKSQKNHEAVARHERLSFFTELCNFYHYQAVMLAHHQDDQAETVLKQVLEGKKLSKSWGMEVIVKLSDLTLWRPLLDIPKIELEKHLASLGVQHFFDVTNLNPRFLRGRMRTQILPQLSKNFGKEIRRNLCFLGKESQEIQSFLTSHLSSYLNSIEVSSAGSFLDFGDRCPSSLLEIRFILSKFYETQKKNPNRETLDLASEYILSGGGNKFFQNDNFNLIVDRKRIFLMRKNLGQPTEKIPLQHSTQCGSWLIEVEKINDYNFMSSSSYCTNWKSAWKGYGEAILPEGENYEVGPPVMANSYPKNSPISKWWNNHKIPAFLRRSIPVIWQDGGIAHEFLTGKSQFQLKNRGIKVKLLKLFSGLK